MVGLVVATMLITWLSKITKHSFSLLLLLISGVVLLGTTALLNPQTSIKGTFPPLQFRLLI